MNWCYVGQLVAAITSMSLYDSLSSLASFAPRRDAVVIDNLVFRLHYVWTVTFLVAFSVLLSLSQVRVPKVERKFRKLQFAFASRFVRRTDQTLNVSATQYAGDPIDCTKVGPMSDDVFDRYCWVEGTWTRRNLAASVSAPTAAGVSQRLASLRCYDLKGDERLWVG